MQKLHQIHDNIHRPTKANEISFLTTGMYYPSNDVNCLNERPQNLKKVLYLKNANKNEAY